MGTQLHGSLVLQGCISLASQIKHILKLLARKRLGTRLAKYPFSRCLPQSSTCFRVEPNMAWRMASAVKSNKRLACLLCLLMRCYRCATLVLITWLTLLCLLTLLLMPDCSLSVKLSAWPNSQAELLGIQQTGVQWEGGAVDWGSTI